MQKNLFKHSRVSTLIFLGLAISAMAGSGFLLFLRAKKDSIMPDIQLPVLQSTTYINRPTMKEGNFTLDVHLPLNETTLVRYIVPYSPETGRPASSASNIVFYAPYNGEEARLKRDFPPWIRKLAELYEFTVFTFTVNTTSQASFNEKEYYIYSTGGWYDLIFKMQEQLQNEFNLGNEKLIMVGESSGGSMIQQMIARYPEKIKRAAWCGGQKYTPFKTDTRTKILAINIWGCPGEEPTRELQANARKLGIDFQFMTTPPNPKSSPYGQYYHHAPWNFQYELMTDFITNTIEETDDMSVWTSDFTQKASAVLPLRPSTKGLVVMIWNKPVSRNHELKDALWFLHNNGYIPAYIRDSPKLADNIKTMRTLAQKHGTKCTFLAETLSPNIIASNLLSSIVLYHEDFYTVLDKI